MAFKDFGDVIIIGTKGKREGEPIEKRAEAYAFAILKSLQPVNYEKYGSIKIQFTYDKLPLIEYILSFFTSLWVEEEKREKKKITVTPENGNPYDLEIIEVTLKLHPKLRR